MNPPTEPGPNVPTEGDALAAYLVNFYRYSLTDAARAIQEQEADDAIPETLQHRAGA